jgi:hypothetical protein
MNSNIHMLGWFSRKTLCIALAVVIALGFLAGGAMADSCTGGADCLICVAATHSHLPGMDGEIVNRACGSSAPNSSCGFETGPRRDEFDRIAAVAESGGHSYSGIFMAASDEFDPSYLHRGFLTQFQYPHRGEPTPIYLRNQSLLR